MYEMDKRHITTARTMRKYLSIVGIILIGSSMIFGSLANMPTKNKVAAKEMAHVAFFADPELTVKTVLNGDGKRKPFSLEVEIKNISRHAVEIDEAHLFLEKQGQTDKDKQALGPNYWAPGTTRFMPGYQPPPSKQKIRIAPNQTISFSIRLNDLKWGQILLSVYPHKGLGELLEPGSYDLGIELSVVGEPSILRSEPVNLIWSSKR